MKPNVPHKKLITRLCKQIEKEEKVKILFAVENGSRAWRMDSVNSDYDVRFVFHHQLEKYISLKPPKDVIQKFYDESGKKHVPEGCFIDIVGFDIFKYLKLLASSNPTTIEWLKSDIVYYGKQDRAFQDFAFNHFNKLALFYHYKSLAKQNYEKYIKSDKYVTYKKYLYVIRGLTNAAYVEEHNVVPPIELSKAISGLNISDSLKGLMLGIIRLKREGKEKQEIGRLKILDDYIERLLQKDMEPPKKTDKKAIEMLDKELRKILLMT
jgi:hypothetical protein